MSKSKKQKLGSTTPLHSPIVPCCCIRLNTFSYSDPRSHSCCTLASPSSVTSQFLRSNSSSQGMQPGTKTGEVGGTSTQMQLHAFSMGLVVSLRNSGGVMGTSGTGLTSNPRASNTSGLGTPPPGDAADWHSLPLPLWSAKVKGGRKPGNKTDGRSLAMSKGSCGDITMDAATTPLTSTDRGSNTSRFTLGKDRNFTGTV
mmetsp:Transcript_40270/g.100793  ORF Transcript_40270/g.100793 Transcript_40270/m.100793 type:complete len:200 (-) Transcript_40270:1214-1813(-)